MYTLFCNVGVRLVKAVEEGSKWPYKSLKGFKLRRTTNLTCLKTRLKLHAKIQCLRVKIRDKYARKILYVQNISNYIHL